MSTKAHLYINPKGYYVTRHSYSGSEDFHQCARKYYLKRVQGWGEKADRAAKYFGIAIEKAVTRYHQVEGSEQQRIDAAIFEFQHLWSEQRPQSREEQKLAPLVYSKADGDWEMLNISGVEMIRLYIARFPSFPFVIPNPERAFQDESNIEMFPGTSLAGIELTAYIDLIGQIKGSFEPIIIDIKTSGTAIPELVSLDPQLRTYAWVKGWRSVGFLWFRKCGRSYSKGDTVYILEDTKDFKAGDKAIMIAKDTLGGIWLTQQERVVDELDAKFKGKSNAVEAARLEYIEANAVLVPPQAVTKQSVEFRSAVISEQSAEDIGKSLKRDIIAICKATQDDFFPMQSGIRFPNEKCPMCAMRGICLGNSELRDQLVARKQEDELGLFSESE